MYKVKREVVRAWKALGGKHHFEHQAEKEELSRSLKTTWQKTKNEFKQGEHFKKEK